MGKSTAGAPVGGDHCWADRRVDEATDAVCSAASQSSYTDSSTHLQLRLEMNFDSVRMRQDRIRFETTFSADLAAALEIQPSAVVVEDLCEGSIIVNFKIKPSSQHRSIASSAPTPRQLAEKLQAMAANPASAIFQSEILGNLDASKGIEVVPIPPPPAPPGKLVFLDDLTEVDIAHLRKPIWDETRRVTADCRELWQMVDMKLAECSVYHKTVEAEHKELWDFLVEHQDVLTSQEILYEYQTLQLTTQTLKDKLTDVERDLQIETIRASMDSSAAGPKRDRNKDASAEKPAPSPPTSPQQEPSERPRKQRNRRVSAPSRLKMSIVGAAAPDHKLRAQLENMVMTAGLAELYAARMIQANFRRRRGHRRFKQVRSIHRAITAHRADTAAAAGIHLNDLPEKSEVAAVAKEIGLDPNGDDDEMMWCAALRLRVKHPAHGASGLALS